MTIYPLFGLIGLGFLSLGLVHHGFGIESLAFSAYSFVLIIFLVTDLRFWRVPRALAMLTIVAGLLLGYTKSTDEFYARLIGGVVAFIFLWCVIIVFSFYLRLVSKIGSQQFAMGSGDPLLLAAIGAFCGWQLLPGLLFLASAQGVIVVCLLKLSNQTLRPPWPDAIPDSAPFGTFLCLAALELAIFPQLDTKILTFIRSLI